MSVESTKKQLEFEEDQSLAENMRKSRTRLNPKEVEAARKFILREREDRNRQTAVAEELKGRIFVGHEGTDKERQIHQKLMASMPKAEEALRSKLGGEFIAVSVFGSHYKGSASDESDADIGVFVRHKNPHQSENLQEVVKNALNFEGKVHLGHYEGLDEVKR